MKKIIALLLLFTSPLIQASTDFDCSMSGMTYYPLEKEISLNPAILIEGYAMDQETIEGFKALPPYLETETGEKIMLELLDINQGQMSISQAMFKPVTSLKPHTDYYLNFQRAEQNEKENPTRFNYEKEERERVVWSTSDLKNSKTLSDQSAISLERTNVELFGCGPAANAIFEIKNPEDQETWYQTEFVDLDTGKSTTYILTTHENKLYVGHGMCSGAFTYSKTGNYKVRFTPMNTDGELSKITQWFTFESPFVGEDNPLGF
jgi:hypothetical protein